MFALIRWLQKFAKRERLLLHRYERAHPHFLVYLAADALLTIFIIGGAIHYFVPQIWDSDNSFVLENPSFVPAPISKFLDYMTGQGKGIYWIGPRAGDKYKIEGTGDRKHRVSYFPENYEAATSGQPELSVTTFADVEAFNTGVHVFLGAQTEKMMLSKGSTIEFRNKSPRNALITFPDRPEIIWISYERIQSKEELLAAGEKLQEIG